MDDNLTVDTSSTSESYLVIVATFLVPARHFAKLTCFRRFFPFIFFASLMSFFSSFSEEVLLVLLYTGISIGVGFSCSPKFSMTGALPDLLTAPEVEKTVGAFGALNNCCDTDAFEVATVMIGTPNL